MTRIKRIDTVLSFLDQFEADGFSVGTWNENSGITITTQSGGSHSLPSFELSQRVIDFQTTLHEQGWIDSKFNWPDWQETATAYVNSPEKLNSANIETIRKLFTTHIRKEKFSEGHLAAMFENGHIVALLRRLGELRSKPEKTAMNSIFSTYSTGENRVTASFLAVLRSLSLDRMERLLGALLGQSEFELVRFENQIAKGGKSVPDALIQANCRILIETKIDRNAVYLGQIQDHLLQLPRIADQTARLLVITPDEVQPAVLDGIDDRVVWTSFTAMDQAIDELLDDKYTVVSEREAFLLRELQSMLLDEGLIAGESDVVIVAARKAWPEYHDIHAYVCQVNRSFQHVSRIGFYSKGQIYPLIPRILEPHDDVEIKRGGTGPLGKLVTRLIEDGRVAEGEFRKIMLLSAPDSPDTLQLPGPIPNDLRSKSGTPWAFTLNQRYVSTEALLKAKTTSDLVVSK